MYFYYIVILVIILLNAFVYSLSIRNKKKTYIALTFTFLIIVSGIRGYECGGDLHHYLASYPILGNQSLLDNIQDRTKYGYFFALLCKIAYFINTSKTSFLFITSIVSLVPIAVFIYRFSPRPLLSIFLYITFSYYTDTFNNVRASLALGVCVLLIKYVIERKKWKFLLGYLIALEIHQTVLPFIFVYYLYNVKINWKRIGLCIGSCFVMSQLLKGLFALINTLAVMYDPVSYSSESTMEGNVGGGYNLLLLVTAMVVFFFYQNKKYYKLHEVVKDKNIYKRSVKFKKLVSRSNVVHLLTINFVIGCCILCFATVSTELTRLSTFYTISMIILIPYSLMHIKDKVIGITAKCLCVIFFMGYFYVFIMRPNPNTNDSNSQLTLPYYTFWQKRV